VGVLSEGKQMARTTCVMTVALLLASSALAPRPSRGADVKTGHALVVIIARSTGVTDIASSTLRSAFLGYPAEYKGGKRLIPFNHPTGTSERISFDRALLGLEPGDVGRFWIDRRIRVEGRPPNGVPSADLALRVVAGLPGAISYLATEPTLAAVRVLTVDGKRFSDPGYMFAKR
jgi:hypothetical protein